MSNEAASREVLRLLQAAHIDRETAKSLLTAIRAEAAAEPGPDSRTGAGPVAIIGVALQLPGADDLDSLWQVFSRPDDMIMPLPADRRALCKAYLDRDGERLGVDAGRPYMTAAWLDGIDLFDAGFFGMTPAEADVADPQLRRFLTVAYECIERAGYAGQAIRGSRTGVYVAAAETGYLDALPEVSPVAVPGNVPSFVASRLSYLLDLRGPSYVASSTCASSFIALHDALNGLALGDCDMAMVGGVNIFPYPVRAARWMMNASGIMADDDRCRPFDDAGGGIGRGEGVAAFLLKPLAAARRDGDHVLATILASAVNSDGTSAAVSAPSPAAHTRLLLEAWRRAGITPLDLDYIEAHGTGTRLGDPIEIKGITDAVRQFTGRRQFLAVGSVKGHVGHLLDGMAGLSGLLRALLVLRHQTVPPTANFAVPNQHIDFLASPVFVPAQGWPLDRPAGRPLRAGVSCFGFNGTNAHVVLEEEVPVPRADAGAGDSSWLFPLSARTREELARLVRRWTAAESGGLRAGDVAYTLWKGREHFAERIVVTARDLAGFLGRCRELEALPPELWGGVDGVLTDAGTGLAGRYLAGEDPDPDELFRGHEVHRAELPTYPFRERSHWSAERPDEGQRTTGETNLSAVIRLVAETLGLDEVDAGSSFLALGGTSLSALQLSARLRRDLGLSVPAQDLITGLTLAELAGRLAEGERDAPGRAAGVIEEARVSTVQRRFWLLEQMEGETGHYNIPLLLWLKGAVDAAALGRALSTIEQRHAVLRYRYPADESGLPVLVSGVPPVELRQLTVAGTDPSERALEAARAEIAERFDLETGPVWRALLIRTGPDAYLLTITMHHIVSDIWSLTLLDTELRAFYAAEVTGVPAAVTPLTRQYSDWAAWESRQLAGERRRELETFWRETLAGASRIVELPADRPRLGDAPPAGGHLSFDFDPGMAPLVSAAAAASTVTPFMLMLAALAIVVYRLTGEADIVIGTETANRTAPESDVLIGSFVNQLPIRVSIDAGASAADVLELVRSRVLAVVAHQSLPFDQIVRLSGQRRVPGTRPLFGLKLLFSDLSWHEDAMAGLDVEYGDADSAASPFDCTLRVFRDTAGHGRLFGSVSYRPDLYDPATIDRFVRQFQDVLREGLAEPSVPVLDLPVPGLPVPGTKPGGWAGRRRRVISPGPQTMEVGRAE